VYFIYFTATGCALIRQSDNVPEKRGMLWCRIWRGSPLANFRSAPISLGDLRPFSSIHLRVCVESAKITRALLIWYANTAKNEGKGGAKVVMMEMWKVKSRWDSQPPFRVDLLRNTFVYLQFKVSNEVRCEDIKRE